MSKGVSLCSLVPESLKNVTYDIIPTKNFEFFRFESLFVGGVLKIIHKNP